MQSFFDILHPEDIRDICHYVDPCTREIVASSCARASHILGHKYVSILTVVSQMAKKCDIGLLRRLMRFVDPDDELISMQRMSIHDILSDTPRAAFEAMIMDAAVSIMMNARTGTEGWRLVREFFDIPMMQNLPLDTGSASFSHFYFSGAVLVGFILRNDVDGLDPFLDMIMREDEFSEPYSPFTILTNCCNAATRAQLERMTEHICNRMIHDERFHDWMEMFRNEFLPIFGIEFARVLLDADDEVVAQYIRDHTPDVSEYIWACCPAFLEWMIATIPDMLSDDNLSNIILNGSQSCSEIASNYCSTRGGITANTILSLSEVQFDRAALALTVAAPGPAGDHLRAMADERIMRSNTVDQYYDV